MSLHKAANPCDRGFLTPFLATKARDRDAL
jgi:hypothetical protein